MTEAGIRAALAAGAAGVIAKSINESEAAARQLDLADYVQLSRDGEPVPWARGDLGHSLFNRSGLGGHDPAAWFTTIAALDQSVRAEGRFVAASVILGEPAQAAALAGLAVARGVRVVELNVGAPHASEARAGAITAETDPARLTAVVRQVRAATAGAVLWVKLTGLSDNIAGLARAARAGRCRRGRADGPLHGHAARSRYAEAGARHLGRLWRTLGAADHCRWLALTRRAVGKEFPLVGTNGARTGRDVARMVLAGARAVELTSAVMQGGFAALTQARDTLEQWLTDKQLQLSDVVGAAADALGTYGDQPARPGHWRNFIPPESREP
ncbi:MAG: dihydroorotate dehydrogenase [Pseudomonadota bacterium]